MGLFKTLFSRNDNSFEKVAEAYAPRNPDPKSDYVLAGTISGGIDSIAQDMGADALDKTTAVLNYNGEVTVVFSAVPFQPMKDVKAFFPVKNYDKFALLKKGAGKRDNMNYMIVDIAGREILEKLKG